MKLKMKMVAFLLAANCLHAQDLSGEDFFYQESEPIQLKESVISSDYIEVDAVQSTKNVKVITKEQIEKKGYTTLSEVLDDVPSINVSKTGYGEIDIRGQGSRAASRNVQVMVDGAPINSLTQHPYKTDYNIVPVSQIEKIEIIEGGGAVLYGSGTSGGIINITTNLKTMSKPVNSVGYEYEEGNKKRYFANGGANITDDLVLQLNYAGEDSDLYFVDTFKKTDYFGVGLSYRMTDKQTLSLKYSYFEEEGKYVYNVSKANLEKYGKDYKPDYTRVTVGYDKEKGEYIYEKKRRYNESTRKSEGLKLSHIYEITDNIDLMTDLFAQWGDFRNSHYEDKDMNYENVGAKVKLSYKYGEGNRLLLGTDYYTQESTLEIPRYKKGFKDEFNYEKEVKALFFHNLIKLNNFEFTQGARKDVTEWTTKKPKGPYSKYQGTSLEHTSERRNEAYELSGAWLYNDTGRIFVRYERGFTNPDGIQVTDEVYIGKEKLYKTTEAEDEIYDTFEVGMRDYILGSYITATAFLTTTDNELQRVSIKNSQGRTEKKTLNLLETKRYGFEFTAEQIFGKLTLFESYSWLKGKTDYNSDGEKLIDSGKQVDWSDSGLQKVPEHSFTVGADYDLTKSLVVGVTVKYVGGYNNYFDEAEREEDSLVKSYTITDFRASYDFHNGLLIYGGIKNAFNEKYYNYVSDGYSTVSPADERSYFAGAKYNF